MSRPKSDEAKDFRGVDYALWENLQIFELPQRIKDALRQSLQVVPTETPCETSAQKNGRM